LIVKHQDSLLGGALNVLTWS